MICGWIEHAPKVLTASALLLCKVHVSIHLSVSLSISVSIKLLLRGEVKSVRSTDHLSILASSLLKLLVSLCQ